jgi:Mce-associated membrane protein
MNWPKRRRAGDPTNSDSLEQTSDEAEQKAADEDDSTVTEVSSESDGPQQKGKPAGSRRRIHWSRAITYGILPGLALLLACAAGFLKWQGGSAHDAQVARAESVRAATESTIALLSYKPETVEKDLETARARLTGTFLNAYNQLTHDVVIPGARQKQISAAATVPAATSVQATASHAVVLLFVNQTVTVGQDVPTSTTSSVRVTLDRVGGRWLISQFDPV